MKKLIQFILITSLFLCKNLQAMEGGPNDIKEQSVSKKEVLTSKNFIKSWMNTIQATLTVNSVKCINYCGDNMWIHATNGRPFAIIKPNHQMNRPTHTSVSKWRTTRNEDNESASIFLAHKLGFKEILPLHIPISANACDCSFPLTYLDDPLEGSVEYPIELIDATLLKSANKTTCDLLQFGQFILDIRSNKTARTSYSISLADLNALVDGDFGERRKKIVQGSISDLMVKGCKEFQHKHLKYFLDNINKDSLVKAGLLDMLLYHRDMKEDNVMLRIDAKGFNFIIIDFEYAMLPFVAPKVKSKKEQLFLNNATNVNFRPFYINFPQSKEPITKNHFEYLLELTPFKVETILSHKYLSKLSEKGINDFLIRLNWLQNLAHKIINDEISSPSLHELYKAFKATHLGKGKVFKDLRFLNKNRYTYTPVHLSILNPSRPPAPAAPIGDQLTDEFEKSLIMPSNTITTYDLYDNYSEEEKTEGYEN